MRNRHWEGLSQTLGCKVAPGPDLCLSALIRAGIMDKLEALQDISDNASREYSLEKQLDGMQVGGCMHAWEGAWEGGCMQLCMHGRVHGSVHGRVWKSSLGCGSPYQHIITLSNPLPIK